MRIHAVGVTDLRSYQGCSTWGRDKAHVGEGMSEMKGGLEIARLQRGFPPSYAVEHLRPRAQGLKEGRTPAKPNRGGPREATEYSSAYRG